MKYLKTSEKIQVENYPYGFRLKTTLTDYIEFDKKKGYRHCTQTIDPRNGRLNAPKKSTYYPLMFRYYDENGHIKTYALQLNGHKEINMGTKFLAENFDILSPDEIKYFYGFIQYSSILDFKATCIYAGSKPEELKPLYSQFWKLCKEGSESGLNLFDQLVLDVEAIEATKPKNYNPFKVTQYSLAG